MSQANLPPLPTINGDVDLVLDLYTHSSISQMMATGLNEDYGDVPRLAEIGRTAVDFALNAHYYFKRPFLTAQQITNERNAAITPEKLDDWLTGYNLKNRIRYNQSAMPDGLNDQALRDFFNAYVGAILVRNGLQEVQNWISGLVDPDSDQPPPTVPDSQPAFQSNVPQQQFQNPQQLYQNSQPQYNPSTPPQNFQHAPPPMNTPPPAPSSPGQLQYPANFPSPSLITLAHVNQTAIQKGCNITYSAEQVGPPHMPTWTVKCFVNGEERGRGTGKNQKMGKEDAAKQAYFNMGW
ncbi:hypothetical protein C8J56DRAFT_851701 [Mycena floridula]|nr:hypothetical protein C8J56DRAFT_851701 [Mycena floridula]